MTSDGRKIYHVTLDADARHQLPALVDRGQGSKERRKRAHILVLADPDRAGGGRRDADIADVLGVGTATVERVRKPCVMDGVEAALERKVQVNRKQRLLDGAGEAKLTMLACSEPPAGQAQWTLQRLADRRVEWNIVETISRSTVQKTLKKTRSSPGEISVGAFRPGGMRNLSVRWKMSWTQPAETLPVMKFGSAWMKPPGNKRKKPGHRCRHAPGTPLGMTAKTPATAPPISS